MPNTLWSVRSQELQGTKWLQHLSLHQQKTIILPPNYRTHHGTGYDVNHVEDFRVTFVFENYDAHSRKKNNDVHDEVPTLEIEIEIDNSSVLKVLRCPTKGLSRKQEPTFRMFSFGGFHVSHSFGQFYIAKRGSQNERARPRKLPEAQVRDRCMMPRCR